MQAGLACRASVDRRERLEPAADSRRRSPCLSALRKPEVDMSQEQPKTALAAYRAAIEAIPDHSQSTPAGENMRFKMRQGFVWGWCARDEEVKRLTAMLDKAMQERRHLYDSVKEDGVLEEENKRLRAFVEKVANIFEGRSLGDEASRALKITAADVVKTPEATVIHEAGGREK